MLKGNNINLRLVRESDLEKLYELNNDFTELSDFVEPFMRTEVGMKKRYSDFGFWKDEFGELLITDKEDKIVGTISYFKPNPYQNGVELGCHLFKSEDRGRGYGLEALKIFTAYLFNIKTIERIQLNTATENKASRRIAEKCGFTHEGTIRRGVFVAGKYWDLELYSILREEAPKLSEVINQLK